MSLFAVALIVISSFTHASWNLLARKRRSEALFFRRMLTVTVAVGFVPALVSEWLTRSIPPRAWLYVLGSGLCCGFYFTFLARAYRSSDFTTAYPVARSLPVVFLAVGDVLRGRFPTAMGWLGLLMVAGGCFLAPLQSIRDISFRRYFCRANLWILFAALGVTGYSLIDKTAAEFVDPGPATAARYGYVFFLVAITGYSLFVRLFKVPMQSGDDPGWRMPGLSAFLNFGSYWLVLWAYQLSQRASYVVAFRQFSIIVGVVAAFLLYKERGVAVRLTGSVLLTVGLVIIALWGG